MTTFVHSISYCTNVHAGATFEQVRANLAKHATAVRQEVLPHGVLDVGLWLSRRAAKSVRDRKSASEFALWLSEHGLAVRTMNGFPANDFHQAVVKHAVYEPNWTIPIRLDYTRDLAWVLADLIPPSADGSISTLPLGWKASFRHRDAPIVAAHHLLEAARELARIEEETGRFIHLDLEPEPGCALERSDDVVAFFEGHLFRGPDVELARRYLRVCHDICHAAVMFEDQATMFERYRAAGISVGKVQVSSAVAVDFEGMDDEQRDAAWQELCAFREPRYLHQTVVRDKRGETFYEDLPLAVDAAGDDGPRGEWRVHFHVPIFAESLGVIDSTRAEIEVCLDLLAAHPEIAQLEVETYAWDVLPEAHRVDSLAEGIGHELTWLRDRLSERGLR